MKLYYAVGGGLGHLARAAAFLFSQSIPIKDVILLTASQFKAFGGLPKALKVIVIPSKLSQDLEAYQVFLAETIEQYAVEEIYLDAFPLGILGEWNSFLDCPNLKFYYIARLLNWERYSPLLQDKNPRFEQVFCIEKLTIAHQKFIDAHSDDVLGISLQYPDSVLSLKSADILETLRLEQKPIWLIIHSEPLEELEELLEYAFAAAKLEKLKVNFLIISQVRLKYMLDNLYYLEATPNTVIFETADRIFTACGFNLMQQTKPCQHKHKFLPFPRRYDLQFERAQQRRAKT